MVIECVCFGDSVVWAVDGIGFFGDEQEVCDVDGVGGIWVIYIFVGMYG